MHILRPQFHIEAADALRFASRRGFGVVIAADDDGPRGSHVPFVVQEREDGTAVAQFHLTARNPLVSLADGWRRFLLVVSGADAYVSNDWYRSTRLIHADAGEWLAWRESNSRIKLLNQNATTSRATPWVKHHRPSSPASTPACPSKPAPRA